MRSRALGLIRGMVSDDDDDEEEDDEGEIGIPDCSASRQTRVLNTNTIKSIRHSYSS